MNGQEMAEGSDGSGSELGEMEVASGSRNCESWMDSGLRNARKRRRQKQQKEVMNAEESESEQSEESFGKQREEFKVIIKLQQENASFSEWNPIQLTKALNKLIGEVKSAWILLSGALLIVCRDGSQQGNKT